MTLPADARFEAEIAPGVALFDASHLLPGKGYPRRDPATIDRAFVHHSGARGRDGFAGLLASARYVTRAKPSGRGWPGMPYTYWIQDGGPDDVDRDSEGRLVVYRGQPDDVRSYHTGGEANTFGVGVALQGNTTARPLSWSHEEGLEALLPWLIERHRLIVPFGIGWHSIASSMSGKSKPGCPGKAAEAWLVSRYGRSDAAR